MSAYRRDWRPPEPARKLTGVAWLLVALALAAVVGVWLAGLWSMRP